MKNNNNINSYQTTNNLYRSTLSNLIYTNNNTYNNYAINNNLYNSTLSGNIKYINNFITSLSGNLYVNYLTQTNASSIYQPISQMINY